MWDVYDTRKSTCQCCHAGQPCECCAVHGTSEAIAIQKAAPTMLATLERCSSAYQQSAFAEIDDIYPYIADAIKSARGNA